MAAPVFYLGPVGALQALPLVGGEVNAGLDLSAATQRALGGARTVDYVGAPKRIYQFSGEALTTDELSVLEALALGAYGFGPLVLLDPWRTNQLDENLATGTGALATTEGFMAVTGSITSSTAQPSRGLRSLAWAVTAVSQRMVTGALANVTAAQVTDIPVLPSTSYAAAVKARLSASTGSARLDAYWFTAAGAAISSSTGTAAALSTGGTTTLSVVATSPATAALLRLSVTNTAYLAATTIYLDDWQLAMATSVPAWTMGTGVPRVAITELDNTRSLAGYEDATMTLQEL